MSLAFEAGAERDGGGRRGTLHLPHGDVGTPVFMPVGTAATVKTVEQGVLERLGPAEPGAHADPDPGAQTCAHTDSQNGAQTGAQTGAQIILANTYHLYLRPGHAPIRRLGGVHRFMSWERPMLTDSGGFQVFSLAKLRRITEDGVEFRSHIDGSKHFFSPEHSMAVQIALGADVMMAFDECVETPATWERTKASMGLTHRWARRSLEYWKAHRHEVPWAVGGSGALGGGNPTLTDDGTAGEDGAPGLVAGVELSGGEQQIPFGDDNQRNGGETAFARRYDGARFAEKYQALFGIVQGGMYKDLRAESAARLAEMDFPGYAIGGLAVGEPREVTREMIAHTLEFLPTNKPRYVMGVGYPDEIEEYARMGVDMMDCVLPTRAGRHGLVFAREDPGDRASKVIRLNIKRREMAEDQGPIDAGCSCPVCRRYSRAYLRHLYASGEALGASLNSVHNLHFYLETMARVRASLGSGGAEIPGSACYPARRAR